MVGRGPEGSKWPGVRAWVTKRRKVSLMVSLQVLGKISLSRLWTLRRKCVPVPSGCAQEGRPCRFPETPLICCPLHMMFSNKQSSMTSLDKQIMVLANPAFWWHVMSLQCGEEGASFEILMQCLCELTANREAEMGMQTTDPALVKLEGMPPLCGLWFSCSVFLQALGSYPELEWHARGLNINISESLRVDSSTCFPLPPSSCLNGFH